VRTNRLHVAIAAMITHTPCHVYDNSYGKLSRVYSHSLGTGSTYDNDMLLFHKGIYRPNECEMDGGCPQPGRSSLSGEPAVRRWITVGATSLGKTHGLSDRITIFSWLLCVGQLLMRASTSLAPPPIYSPKHIRM